MSDNRPIGLFDSGVGGLSVFQEIKKILPNENFVILADQANVPYGAKTKKDLIKLTEGISRFLLDKNIKLLVVACNTASVYTIDNLRKKFDIPIVGVVPAVKTAVKISKKGKVAIMSTPATSNSLYLKRLIKEYAPKSKVLNLACSGLEDSVEILNYQKINSLLDKYLLSVKNAGSDVIILGCTHFPFLKKEISNKIGKTVKIIDSGRAIASRVKQLLSESDNLSKKRTGDLFYTTLSPSKFSSVASTLLQYKIISSKAKI